MNDKNNDNIANNHIKIESTVNEKNKEKKKKNVVKFLLIFSNLIHLMYTNKIKILINIFFDIS